MDEQLRKVRAFNRFFAVQLNVFDRHTLGTELTLTEGRIIGDIGRHPDWTANDIAEHLHVDKSYISRLLQKFEKKKYIIRVAHRDDQRKKCIQLTASGKRLFDELERLSDDQAAHMMTKLSSEERHLLVEKMNWIQSVLQK